MADFPLFIKMDKRKVIVIGGGAVALRKVRVLMEYGADIQVIADEMCEALRNYSREGRISCLEGKLSEESLGVLDPAFLVICASDDREVNRMAADYCRKRHILADCADPGDISDCVFPSVVRRENVVIGISTSGGVPALSRHLREKISSVIPEWYGEMEKELRKKRIQLKASGLSQPERRQRLRQWIQEEEKIRESGECRHEDRNKKEPSGDDTDGNDSRGNQGSFSICGDRDRRL